LPYQKKGLRVKGTLPEVHEGTIIRRATLTDLRAIVGLLANDELGSMREDAKDPLAPAYVQAFEMIDADPRHELIVIEADRQMLGTLQLTFIPSLTFQGGMRAQVEGVRVAEQHRSRGVGQVLLTWVIARAHVKGCRIVQLTTNKGRTEAHRFYQRLGFVASHEGLKLDLSMRTLGGESTEA
jgi:GNAT superfamily N-acetyltransferase